MKFLRFLLILIIILVVAAAILHFTAPKTTIVTRSTTINAPREVVFDQITHFKNWPNWSPWYEMDPKAAITYFGDDGMEGSGYSWVGTKEGKTGEGEMKNGGIMGDTMKYLLHFKKPFEADAQGYLIARDAGNGTTEATWVFIGENKFPGTVFTRFMDMDAMLGKDFEKGLANLKKVSESNSANMPAGMGNFNIQETQFPGHTYMGVRKVVAWDDMQKFFADTYGMLGKSLGQRISGPATGLYYTWDTVKHQADMAAVFPVSGDGDVAGATKIDVPSGKAYMVEYHGGYAGSMGAHEALGKHIDSKNETMDVVIEEYIKGPGDEKDSTKWVTNIYYKVK